MSDLKKHLHELKQALAELHQRELKEFITLLKKARTWNNLQEHEKSQLAEAIEKCGEKYNSVSNKIEIAIEKTTQLIDNTTKK